MNNGNQQTIRYADLFGGVGGFRLGIERANDSSEIGRFGETENISKQGSRSIMLQPKVRPNPTCVFYNDIDKYAVQTYNKNFGEDHEATDIRTIETDSIPDIDILCGGFPCQAFSIAGKRRGFQDTRGTLFFEIARIIKAKRPKIIFLENVKGLLNHNKGETFSVIIQTLSELGYDVQWMVLNSKFFGVPQNRERVFIIGSLRGERRPEILPFGFSGEEINSEVIGTLNTDGWEKRHEQIRRVWGTEGVAPTIPTGTGGGVMTKIVQPAQLVNKNRARKPYNPDDREMKIKVRDDETSYTVKSATHEFMVKENMKIRRLTPTECERLQGFPDGWTEGVSDTQRYKQMGNAVTVNVIEAIARRLLR